MKKLLLLACMAFTSMAVEAQIMFKTEYFGKSAYRMTEGDKDEKVGNSRGGAIVYQGGVNIPLSMKLNENNRPTVWSIGMGGAYVKLNNENFTEDLVLDEIMNIGLNIMHLRPLNDKWSLLASIGGGIFTPSTRFSKIRFDNVLGNAGVVFIRHLRSNLDIGGGLAFNNSFGYPMVFPAFYLDWKTQGPISVKVSMFDGLELSAGYEAGKNISLQIVAEMNGQMALLEKDNKDMMFTHQYIITGFRPEFKLGKHISIPITAGIHAMRTAEFTERTLKSFFSDKGYYFQISPYASAGIRCGF